MTNYSTVRRFIHGQWVDVKVFPAGIRMEEKEDDVDGLLLIPDRPEPTVQPTGMEFYLIKED